MTQMTLTEIAKKLDVGRGTLYRLRRQWPDQVPKTNDIEKWRAFALAHVIDPDVICRLAR